VITVETFEKQAQRVGEEGKSTPYPYIRDDMGGVKSLVTHGKAEFLYCRIPDVVEYLSDQFHFGVFCGQVPAELHEGTAG
jgi:hypothetical protein